MANFEFKTSFIERIVTSRSDWNDWKVHVDNILEKVDTYDDFEQAVLNDENLKHTQLYAEVSRNSSDGNHRNRLLEYLHRNDGEKYTT